MSADSDRQKRLDALRSRVRDELVDEGVIEEDEELEVVIVDISTEVDFLPEGSVVLMVFASFFAYINFIYFFPFTFFGAAELFREFQVGDVLLVAPHEVL